MSRSIHATRQQLTKARRFQYADEAVKVKILRGWRGALNHKRWTKRQRRQETAHERQPAVGIASTDGTPVDIAGLPIEIDLLGASPYVHHAASVEDLRALLAVLPPGLADGVSRIVLTLGKPDMEQARESHDDECDPFTGRLGWETFQGVYGGTWLGIYRVRSASISLFAYVYDPAKLPLPLPLCELYLRLRTLTTFAHELAHHFDEMRRVARGRWLARGKNRVERYAEAREHAWGQEFVVPLLRQRYPGQVQALDEWIAYHGGVKVPLESLAGDPRTTRKDRLFSFSYDAGAAFRFWLDDLGEKAPDLFASRFAFAHRLHLGDQYELCLQVLDGLLIDWPPTLKVWGFKADTLVHLERWDELEACVRQMLALDATSADAWKYQSWVAVGRQDWPGVLEATQRWLDRLDPQEDRFERRNVMFHRAVALCGLAEFARMEACLALSAVYPGLLKRRREEVYRRAGLTLLKPDS